MLTPQQQAFTAACSLPGNLALKALAGTGKTFSLQAGADELPGSGLSTSFQKSTVEELGKKMPSSFPAKGLHALGLAAIKPSFKKVDVDTRGNHRYGLVTEELKRLDEEWSLAQPILRLIDAAETAGIVPNHDRCLMADTEENWEALADKYDILWSPLIYDLARATLQASNTYALKEGKVTFGQMLSLPLFFSFRPALYSTIIVDEAQDLSPIQHAFLERILRPNGRIICAGDPNQAIFAFAGAMSDSYSALSTKFVCTELPLTVSWRCPQAVVRAAQLYVPEFEAAPGAIEGDVIEHGSLSIYKVPPIVLCRNNAPLVRLALRLLVSGISAEVAGRDIGQGLIALTKRIAGGKNSDNLRTEEFIAKLHAWAEREITRKPKLKPRVQDKVSALEAIAAEHAKLGAVRTHLGKLFPDPKSPDYRSARVHLTTIHKAKGKEWPEVLFLDPQLLPSKYAEQPWEKQQEKNLAYVGITRTKEILHYCTSDGIE